MSVREIIKNQNLKFKFKFEQIQVDRVDALDQGTCKKCEKQDLDQQTKCV